MYNLAINGKINQNIFYVSLSNKTDKIFFPSIGKLKYFASQNRIGWIKYLHNFFIPIGQTNEVLITFF